MENKVISNITLDVSGTVNTYTTLRAKQGDSTSRYVCATIMDGASKYTVDESSDVVINFKRHDLKVKSYSGDVQSDGTVLLPLPYWALELPYVVRCDVSILNGTDNKLTTFAFYIQVESAAVSDEDIQADETTSYLLSLIKTTQGLADDFTGYFVNDNTTQAVDVIIADRTLYCYSAGITSCVFTIPETAEQGWVADFELKIGALPVVISVVNKSEYMLKMLQYANTIDTYTAPANSIVKIYVTIGGILATCVIEEYT